MIGSSNDPFVLQENYRSDVPQNNVGNQDTSTKTFRDVTYDTYNLVLITAGDSNMAGVGPSLFTPTHASAIDNYNIYDGGNYNCADPLLGCALGGVGIGGNISGRVADAILTRGVLITKIFLVPLAVGGSTVAMWAAGGVFYNRIPVAMARLAARGITPGSLNTSFALVYQIGANDHGISSATFTAAVQQTVTKAQSAGFAGRVFIPTYSILANAADAGVTTGQANLIDSLTYFSGGNIDSLTGGVNRQADGTHLTAAGQASAATLIEAAMHASGSPY